MLLMILRSTTSRSHALGAILKPKIVLATVSVVMLLTFWLFLQQDVNATDRFQQKIDSLQIQAQEYEASANQLRQQGDTLQAALNILNAQVGAKQAEVAITQARLGQLSEQIADSNRKLAETRDTMGVVISNIYVDDKISPLEMLASSDNIGDYVDKQAYRTAVRDSLNLAVKEISRLKIKLEDDKREVDKQLAALKVQEADLAAKQGEQQNLVAQTRGEEDAYRRLVQSRQADIAKEQAAREAFLQSLQRSRGSIYNSNIPFTAGATQLRNITSLQSCGGGYPTNLCAAPMNSVIDKHSLYSRQCVSYSAWRAEDMGYSVGDFAGQGHAYQWPMTAQRMGAVISDSAVVGAVAITDASNPISPGYGHTMNVEAILPDGWVRVSQYNFGGTGMYNTMEVKGGLTFVVFPRR